jgi:hypothetical protein
MPTKNAHEPAVMLVLAKKTAAGPGGYVDAGTGPVEEPGPAGSTELGEELLAMSERLCEIAAEMGAPKSDSPDSDAGDSPDEEISEARELS